MPNQVELSVKTDLEKVIEILSKIKDGADEIPEALKKGTKGVDDEVRKQASGVEGYLSNVMRFGSRLANNLRNDFKSLFNVQGFAAGLQISKQFQNAGREAFELSDIIRKLGPVFKIASSDFQGFQTNMVKGLGELGLSSEVAVDALKGLADTPVRGQDSLIEYARTAGQLASISGEQGKEGAIAKGISGVAVARGANPNNTNEVRAIAEDLRRVFNQTGQAPTKTLDTMERIFANMATDLRKQVSTRGIANLAGAAQVAGPNVDEFFKEFLSKSKLERLPMEAQGLKDIVTDKGLDTEKFQKVSKQILSRIGMDPRASAETLGLSEQAAEGFVRLSQSLDKVKAAQDAVNKSTGDLTNQYQKSKGFGEAFKGTLNRTKSAVAGPMAAVTNTATDLMSKATESDAGAMAVTAGSAIVAAMLTGGGLRGIGKDLFGSQVKSKALETITGEQIQKVFVTNASDIGGGMMPGLGGAAGGGGFLSKIGLLPAVGMAAAAGVGIGSVISDPISKMQGTTEEGFTGDPIERAMFKIAQALDKITNPRNEFGDKANILPPMARPVKVEIDLKSPKLKATVAPSRGVSN